MALTYVGSSTAWVYSATAVTPGTITGVATGDCVIVTLFSKYDNATISALPTGWTLIGAIGNTGRSAANDDGNTRTGAMWKIWAPGDTMPSLNPANNNVSGVQATAYRGTLGSYDLEGACVADNNVGTPLLLNPGSNLGATAGDIIHTAFGVNGDVVTFGTTTLAVPGCTLGTMTTNTADGVTTTGTDARNRTVRNNVVSGTPSGNVSVSTVLAGTTTAAVGTGLIVRVRDIVPPAVTQAGYQFYADGTETGATALAGQNTAPTVDTSSGDVNLGLRVRLQETGGGILPAATDWQLQSEKNTSGTWANVVGIGSPTVADSYAETNADSATVLTVATSCAGQTFLGDGNQLTGAGFYLNFTNSFLTASSLYVELYAHTGTFGAGGRGTGAPLATSAARPGSVVTATAAWVDFTFDGGYTLGSGTPYAIVVRGTVLDASRQLGVAIDISSPAHAGNAVSGTASSQGSSATQDAVFRVTTAPLFNNPVVGPYWSANLINGAATTNRLTGGTGTFLAGKVSENGAVDDLGWSASNHTEVLYSVRLKQADLAPSDTLRFRVLKNGATTGLTYTAVPSVTIGAGGPATIQATVALVAASTLTATAVPERAAAVTLTAASTLTTAGVPARVASVALSAVSTLTATGVRIPQATASLVAASTLTVTATRFGVPLATVALAGVSTLSATGVREPQAVVSLTATSTLVATGTTVGQVAASVSLTATGTLTATAVREPQATVGLVASSTLTVTATRFGVLLATVPMAAAGTFTATAVRIPQASASLTAISSLTADGIRTQHATSTLVAASQLTTGAVVARVPVVALSAVSTLTATAVRIPQATVSLTAGSTLTAAATTTPAVFGTVAMSAAATLTATAVREPQATVSLVAASTLTATATRTTDATAPLDAISTLTVLADAGPRPAGYLEEVLADGPTVLWLLDEAAGATTAADSSGSGKTGTVGSAVTFGTVGSGLISGYPTAATFPGGGVPASQVLNTTMPVLSTAPVYTLELWVKGTTAGAFVLGQMTSSVSTSRCVLGIQSTTGRAYFRVYDGSSAALEALSTTVVTDGNPHHLVGVCDADTDILRLYVDGVERATAAAPGVLRFPAQLLLGGPASGTTFNFVGAAGGVAYYGGAKLSPERVAAHYAAGTAEPVVSVPATAALVASSTLTAAATTTPAKFATAALTATSTLSATAVREPHATVSLTAASTLTATAGTTGATFATAALTASSTLTATAVRQPQATVSLTATAVLTVTGVRVRVLAVGLTATSTLTATPTRVRPATVPLTAAATLTVQLVRVPQAFVGMTGTSVLVVTATVVAAAVGIPNAAHTGFLHALDADLEWYPVTVPS